MTKENNKNIELIILLNGNFIPIRVPLSHKDMAEKTLIDCLKAGEKDSLHYIKFGDATIISKNILGWYFRLPVKNTSQELLDVLKSQVDTGEDWKS